MFLDNTIVSFCFVSFYWYGDSYIFFYLSVFLAAVEFLRKSPEGKYDAIVVDSSDPVGKLYGLNS